MSTESLDNNVRGTLKDLDITHVDAVIVLGHAYIMLLHTLDCVGCVMPDDAVSCFISGETGEFVPPEDIFDWANPIVRNSFKDLFLNNSRNLNKD